MSIYIRRFPLIPVTIVFIFGILFGVHICFHPKIWLSIFLLCFLLNVFIHRSKFFFNWTAKSIISLISVFFLGGHLISTTLPQFNLLHFSHYLKPNSIIYGRVFKIQQNRSLIKVISVDGKEGLHGRLLLIAKFNLAENLIHDLVAVSGISGPIRGPRNPGHFDPGKYYRGRGTFHQTLITHTDELRILERDWRRKIPGYLSAWRERISVKLFKILDDKETVGLLKALLIGDRGDLDYQLRREYARAGVAHLLAISGLHVGIIYFILQKIFSLVPFGGSGVNWIRAFFVLGGIWIFGFCSGSAVPVIRAATMFSVFQLGNLLFRKNYNLNNLAFAAFILLAISPWALWDIGFQLSFLAVTGILLGYPAIFGWMKTTIGLLRNTWSLVAVSISAQLFIFPLILFQFHEFPTFFLISSVLLIPLMTVIIWSGIILVLIPEGLVSSILRHFVEYTGQTMHSTVRFVNELPFSVISGVWLKGSGILLLYLLTLTVVVLIHFPHRKILLLSIYFLAGYQINRDIGKLESTRSKLAVYYAKDKSLIHIFTGPYCFEWNPHAIPKEEIAFITTSLKEKNKIRFTIDIHHEVTPISFNHPFLILEDRIVLLLGDNNLTIPQNQKIDWVIIRENASLKSEDIMQWKNASFIIDSSNDRLHASRHEKILIANGISTFNVREGGGVVVNL